MRDKEKSYTVWDLYTQRERFKSSEELEERIQLFFNICKDADITLTYTGLMLVLGLKFKQELSRLRYSEEYGDKINYAIGAIENSYERALSTAKNPTGMIFALKCLGWQDTPQTQSETNNSDVQRIAIQLATLQALRDGSKSAINTVPDCNCTKVS